MTLCYSDCSHKVKKFIIIIHKQFREIWFPARAAHGEETRLWVPCASLTTVEIGSGQHSEEHSETGPAILETVSLMHIAGKQSLTSLEMTMLRGLMKAGGTALSKQALCLLWSAFCLKEGTQTGRFRWKLCVSLHFLHFTFIIKSLESLSFS